jgi:hypothetical protein
VTTITLLQNIQNGVPSGNYDGSSQDFYSDAGKGNGYYQGYQPLQQVEIRVENFQGTVTLQGTLDAIPLASIWVDLGVIDLNDSSLNTLTTSIILLGSYTWIRAHVTDFQAGKIDYLTSVYEVRFDY